MIYRTQYPEINNIDFDKAWEFACQLDPELKRLDPSEQNLQEALVSLARRVAELEKEWS